MDSSIAYGATSWALTPNTDQTSTLDTAVSISGMSVSLKANTKYEFTGGIHHGCSGAGGVRFAITIPSGTLFVLLVGVSTANTALLENSIAASATLNTNGFGQFSNQNRTTRFYGTIQTGATEGAMQISYAAGTAGQTATIYEEGSIITLTSLGAA